jgi:hypothetical protein
MTALRVPGVPDSRNSHREHLNPMDTRMETGLAGAIPDVPGVPGRNTPCLNDTEILSLKAWLVDVWGCSAEEVANVLRDCARCEETVRYFAAQIGCRTSCARSGVLPVP